jgi:D-sedoheptulose 7-phosphate isomerase
MEHIQNYISILQQTMDQLPAQSIVDVICVLQQARLQGNQIFIMGNGGSASTSSHFVCDLAKSTRQKNLPHFRVIGLADNVAIFSAYANDEGYENIFSQQLVNLIRPGDVVIGISASGNSKNVVNAVVEAKKHNVTTIGFTGFDGGRLGQIVDINIHVRSNIIEHVEDIHLMLEHMIVKEIKEQSQPEIALTPSVAKPTADVFGD